MTVILVEGASDAAALEVIARRLRMPTPRILAVGGSKGAHRAVDSLPGERIVGLVDAQERTDFARVIEVVFVCDPDLEAELVRALGTDAVEAVIAQQGELESFRRLQRQPAQRLRSTEAQLARFFGGRSGNKARYARLLAEALPLDRIPAPLAGILAAA
ncbi:hypothetical protein [Microbacterium sp. PA5]|uniref:hypothetical protein n=1 Tax=Microbacterium sp. PA5 TaxID=3416654 RepID=UPI003CEA5FC4